MEPPCTRHRSELKAFSTGVLLESRKIGTGWKRRRKNGRRKKFILVVVNEYDLGKEWGYEDDVI